MKQFAVIGLGNFGYYLATHLYDKGNDVLAIDKNQNLVQKIKDNVTQAVIADSTDLQTIKSLSIPEMDAVVVCIGNDLSASIHTTLNLKDVGVRKVYAKAISEPHGRILRKVGAQEILFPEKDLAINLAERLHNPSLLDYLPFFEGYSIIELKPKESFIQKELRDLDLINKYGVQVIAIKEIASGKVAMIPTGKYVLKGDEVMILLGPNDGLELLRQKEK
ncbi:MAG: TrkA family potassium uptake protein [Desulfobacterales bacterium]|jgi:trk system potassium uptake protein TrkA|nr:TrkA family potassium uptake protein [Desulfobacterales bacterium]